jgi:hypothetical protein
VAKRLEETGSHSCGDRFNSGPVTHRIGVVRVVTSPTADLPALLSRAPRDPDCGPLMNPACRHIQ